MRFHPAVRVHRLRFRIERNRMNRRSRVAARPGEMNNIKILGTNAPEVFPNGNLLNCSSIRTYSERNLLLEEKDVGPQAFSRFLNDFASDTGICDGWLHGHHRTKQQQTFRSDNATEPEPAESDGGH